MSYAIAVIALFGVILNIRKRWEGFAVWLISNGYWCWHNVTIGEYAQGATFAIFWLLSVYGLYEWRKAHRKPGKPGKPTFSFMSARLVYQKNQLLDEIEHLRSERAWMRAFCRRIIAVDKELRGTDKKIKINWIVDEVERILKRQKE